MEDINLLREERRFFIPARDIKKLLQEVEKNFSRKKFSENEYVQTVYLGNDEQTVPWGNSPKARRYTPRPSEELRLDFSDRYLFELKEKPFGSSLGVRKKTSRQEMTLRESAQFASIKLKIPLRPYLVVEYLRQHFIPTTNIPFRLTIDTEIRYWFLEGSSAQFIENGDQIVRIECKMGDEAEEDKSITAFLSFLEALGAEPVISKKEEGYNLIKKYVEQKCARPLIKELTNSEIESKFILEESDPIAFFTAIKEWSRNGAGNIVLDPGYPFTNTTSSINHYWSSSEYNKLKEGVKFLFKGPLVSPVLKSEMVVIDRAHAVVRRKEIKGKKFFYTKEAFLNELERYTSALGRLEYAGYIARSRKAVWLEHNSSGRIYHISLDRCSAPGKRALYQLEIEYSGRRRERYQETAQASDSAETEIIEDTINLASSVYLLAKSANVHLRPDTLSKFHWLVS